MSQAFLPQSVFCAVWLFFLAYVWGLCSPLPLHITHTSHVFSSLFSQGSHTSLPLPFAHVQPQPWVVLFLFLFTGFKSHHPRSQDPPWDMATSKWLDPWEAKCYSRKFSAHPTFGSADRSCSPQSHWVLSIVQHTQEEALNIWAKCWDQRERQNTMSQKWWRKDVILWHTIVCTKP